MGLKIEMWNIAYRKRCNSLLDNKEPFKAIKNGHKGWYADPFLFDYEGDTYLFAEFFSYKLQRGVISYSKFDRNTGQFGDYKEIITEDFHLSYPVIFEYCGKTYMMPETSAADSLFMYECISFPDKWRRLPAVMEHIKLVDTTPFIVDGKLYALTLRVHDGDSRKGDMLLLEFNGEKFEVSKQGILSQDMKTARSAGNLIKYKNKFYRVAQDCSKSYGSALTILELNDSFTNDFSEKVSLRITPEELIISNNSKPSGVHTFNKCKSIEVIDLKYYKNSFYRLLVKVFH